MSGQSDPGLYCMLFKSTLKNAQLLLSHLCKNYQRLMHEKKKNSSTFYRCEKRVFEMWHKLMHKDAIILYSHFLMLLLLRMA